MRDLFRKACLLPFMILFTHVTAALAEPIQLPPVKAGRARPIVAIVADNAGTETTDLMVPYGILKTAEVADVIIVSSNAGKVSLMPALTVEPDLTMDVFDRIHPEGADLVIVPAMHDNKNETIVGWVRAQANKGAFVGAICEGAWIAARAGLLDGRHATTHWYAFDKISTKFPKTQWVRDRRYVVDANVMTTTGVSASIPATLALVEAIGGRAKAKATAAQFGFANWNATHDSERFHLKAGNVGLVIANYLSFWEHETLAIPVTDGFDEIALALSADAWSRTYRSQAITVSAKSNVASKHGLTLVPDKLLKTYNSRSYLDQAGISALSLDLTLQKIAARYGQKTADLVSLQIEYAGGE
ncbi:DJ-1/PfpI family protein [Rhizobium oryzicola]|uniref:DJ-1/PfpI family protein n=1 Tax=Rhizobium oryzicola TaxID=1232668 RepID=A0ABT8T4U8_9HYPH|nr:DJ-1/PfpI family protein [Rhizobium oryzicola]MDO1585439.1 DJ-1/PfpI family protein [Rhizobium oryzicola]